jgi:hypothetical protein
MKLKTEKIYIYYDIPLVFSASSVESGDIFICLFADETGPYIKYLGAPVSKETLGELECNEKDVRSIFESPGKKYSILLPDRPDETLEAVESSEDITPYLPEEGLFIGTQESEVSQVTISVPSDMTSVKYDKIDSDLSNYDYEPPQSGYHVYSEFLFLGDIQCLTEAA